MQGETLLKEHACPAAQAEDVARESSAAEMAQKAAEFTPEEEEARDPATVGDPFSVILPRYLVSFSFYFIIWLPPLASLFALKLPYFR